MPGVSSTSSLASRVKPIYMAKSLAELNQKVDNVPGLKTRASAILIKSLDTLFKEAETTLILRDEEKAYLLFMRCLNLLDSIKKKPDFKTEKYNQLMIGNRMATALKNAEELSNSLNRRYVTLKEINGKEPNAVIEVNGVAKLEEEERNCTNDDDPIKKIVITCMELYDLIGKAEEENKGAHILILDTRSSKCYNESRIDKFKSMGDYVQIHNIPEEILKAGLTITSLEKQLDSKELSAVKKRRTAKKAVLIDWRSSDLNQNHKLNALYDALWKWDHSNERLKSPPLILKNGYKEWLFYYPTFTTNSKACPPEEQPKLTTNEIKRIDFDSLLVDKEKIPPVNGLIKPTNIKPSPLNDITQKAINANTNRILTAPGTAVPVVDRSKKPPSPPKNDDDAKKEEAEFLRRKQDEIDEEKNKLIIDEMQRLEMENTNLRHQINSQNKSETKSSSIVESKSSEENNCEGGDVHSPSSDLDKDQATKTTSRENEIKEDDIFNVQLRKANSERPKTDRTMSESTSNMIMSPARNSTGRGNLSRSYSSPNIAQLVENEENNQLSKSRSSTNPPQFDRNLKPSQILPNLTNRNLTSSMVRNRNLSPIYGIAGETVTGLKNLGNTCFMNAVIQCLAHTTELAVYFAQERHLKNGNNHREFQLAEELGVLIKNMWNGQFKSISPKDFKQVVGFHLSDFTGCEQQDSHEFLTMLLEKIHNAVNQPVNGSINKLSEDLPLHMIVNRFWENYKAKNFSIISELFDGLFVSTLTCSVCKKQSHTFEEFRCLSLEIATPIGNRCSLTDCLDLFSKSEKMTGDGGWECPTCKCKRDADKRIIISRIPKILCIHLKRFSYEGMWRRKLQTFVDFPLSEMSLKHYKYINSPESLQQHSKYQLYGVVNHYGTLEGGHYTAYCHHPHKSKWYKFDDHEVAEISSTDVRTQAAYMLFYAAV